MPELKFHLLNGGEREERDQTVKRNLQTGKTRRGPTFQETHCAVEAFWTEFIVAKGAQQFADDNVRRFRKYKGPHVAEQNADLLPPFGSLSLLQAK